MKQLAYLFTRRVVLFSVLLLLILSLPCCSKKQPESKEIKIGWIGPLTGDLAYYGQMVKKGTDLATEEINAEARINGSRLVVVYHDDELNPKKGVAAFLKLVSTDKVPVVIQAAGSSVMLAEAPLAEKNKVVLISPTCSNPKIRDAGDYVFRTWPSDSYQGVSLSEFIFGKMKKTKVAILYLNNDYGTGVKDEFARKFKALGGKVCASEAFEESATDFRSQLTKVVATEPELIFLSSHYKEGALLLKQASELGIKIQIVASDACYAPEFLQLSGGAAEGCIVANLYWNPDSNDPVVKSFIDKFMQKFGQKPEVYAAAGYDCIKVVALAIKNGGTKSEGIKDALYQIKDYSGVTGKISFDEFGEVNKAYDLFIVRSGEFKPYE